MYRFSIFSLLFAAAISAQSDNSNSNVVAVFILGRHGDRTSKIEGTGLPTEQGTELTVLGKHEAFNSGAYFRNLYLNSSSGTFIQGIDSTTYQSSQLYAQAANEDTLGQTAEAFLQGLYPPSTTNATLANGTFLENPLNGYQYPTINGISSDSPENVFMSGVTACPAYTNASNLYFKTADFMALNSSTLSFYQSFSPLIQGWFNSSSTNFKNAYVIYDYLNVGNIHNATISENLSASDLFQLRTLADIHEYNIAYNATNPATSIGGATLAGAVLNTLNATVNGTQKGTKLTYYNGAYTPMQSFFGLTNMTALGDDWRGVPDYASALVFELHNSSSGDLSLRFGFMNGTASGSKLNYFPLFNSGNVEMSWSDFESKMSKIAITSQQQWCITCSSPQAFCAAYTSHSSSLPSSTSSHNGGSHDKVSPVGAGFIGMAVTLAVVAIVGGLGYLFLRSRKSSRKVPQSPRDNGSDAGSAEKA